MINITLKKILKDQGKTMTWLHEKTGISKNTLSLMANNTSKGIQFDTLEKICTHLKITPNDLIEIQPDKWFVYGQTSPIKMDNGADLFIIRVFTERNLTVANLDDGTTVEISSYPPLDYQVYCFVTKTKSEYKVIITTKDADVFNNYADDTEHSFEDNSKFFNELKEDEQNVLIKDIYNFLFSSLIPYDEQIKFADIRVRMSLDSDWNYYFYKKIEKNENSIELVDVETIL
ncbi:helix-turn-helix domain-containing protein [Vagococcus humatus]|nr:helix-turn-helix domain-containing protein [Vagococcus humatus]